MSGLNIKFEEELEKIENRCIDNDLEYEFIKASFPVVAKISPDKVTQNQTVMNFGDGETQHKNGEIQLVFLDELVVRVIDDFYIADDLLNRLKNASKKLHYIYLQMYFKEKTKSN